jgi:hypothetical protein
MKSARPPSDAVREAIRIAVDQALSPTRTWRREAEVRLKRLELDIAALRALQAARSRADVE